MIVHKKDIDTSRNGNRHWLRCDKNKMGDADFDDENAKYQWRFVT